MSGCQSCNGCQGCNSCESCNVNCNDTGCNTIQAFCSIGAQSVGGFSFNQPVSSNQTFLTKDNWNRLITYIRAAYAEGNSEFSGGTGGDSGLPVEDTNDFMTADVFNKVSEALGNLGSSGPEYRARGKTNDYPGDVIYGRYFEDLESYANNLQYTTSQCDDCNAGCNVTCNGCQKCNSGGCQNNSPSRCCSSCNSCESNTPE